MFGKVISIDKNIVVLENLKGQSEASILNFHVIFEENNRSVVGEIIAINNEEITILLVGEIRNNTFNSGVMKKPTLKTAPRIIYKSELDLLLGPQDISKRDALYIGKSNIYEGYKISASLNEFMANHFAVVGNTGSGKSCGVARLIQNVFEHNDSSLPTNAHICIFDFFGEYNSAFKDLSKIPNINFKSYTTQTDFENGDTVCIPAYFLEVDDLALLLNVTDTIQIPILEETLKLTYIFTSDSEDALNYKNQIISSALLDILSSGKNSTQIRDQLIAILTKYNTENLSLDSIIVQPGYNRTLKQCLNIDNQGKMNSVGAVVDFLNNYLKEDIKEIERDPKAVYSLDDILYAMNFALIKEGTLNNQTMYEKTNTLKVRLEGIINSEHKKYFAYDKYISKIDYVKKLFMTNSSENAQIINMNFNYVDERFAKSLTKIFAKLFYNFSTSLKERASYPIHMILEEAHRYVQDDSDIDIIGYNIYDRITKEGRKYALILGFITQRPSELSKTSLSQCSNFISFRMFHPDDINIVSSISANVDKETIDKIKSLQPGSALVFGSAFKLPLIANFDLPCPMPSSTSVKVTDKWFEVKED